MAEREDNQFRPFPVIITAGSLRVRSQPDTSTPKNIVGRYRRGERVDAYGREGDWLSVSYEGKWAYIHCGYVRPVAEEASAQAKMSAPDAASTPAALAICTPAEPGENEHDGSILTGLMSIFRWLASIPAAFGEDEDSAVMEPVATLKEEGEPSTTATIENAPGSSEAPHAPSGAASLRDQTLAAYIASLNAPHADAAAHQLAALEKHYQELQSDLAITEEKGKGRDALVAGIGEMRETIAGLDRAGLDAMTPKELKSRLYRAVHDIAPNYNQGRNMDLLEGKAQAKELGTKTSVTTRTCNITSLAMALESLGKSPNDYDSSKQEQIIAIAEVFTPEVASAKLTVGGGKDWGAMAGLRLSDFMQLAAIAEVLKGDHASTVDIKAAAVIAWEKILNIYFLKRLSQRFRVGGTVKPFTLDPNKSRKEQNNDASALRGWSRKHRSDVERLVDARNAMEVSGSDKDRQKYQKRQSDLDDAMSGKGIENRIPLASYKSAVQSQIGAELDSGAAIVVQLSGHYVRLQAMFDDHLIVDDPGRHARANRKVTWEEARAMGYFYHRLVLGG